MQKRHTETFLKGPGKESAAAITMQILFVNNFRGRGGGEEFLRDLLPGLVAKGVKVGLVCRPDTPLAGMFIGSGAEVYPLRRSGKDGLASVFAISKIIRDNDYQIVNIQRGHDIIQSWVSAIVSRKRPVLIYTPQVADFYRSRFLLGRMDRIVTISRHIKERMVSFAPRLSSKITIIYYGIDVSRFGPDRGDDAFLRRRFGIAPGTPVIGTVGDLWKNQIEFLDALVEIREKVPGVRYALVAAETGIGQIQQFKQRAADLGISDALLWTGRLSKDEMASFYASIDIAVSTHRNEGFGIWILEALAMRAPVAAFNDGGIRDSLEGCPAGVLIDEGPKEMAAEIIAILSDPLRRATMAEAGPKWVAERFSKERMVEDYYRLFMGLSAC